MKTLVRLFRVAIGTLLAVSCVRVTAADLTVDLATNGDQVISGILRAIDKAGVTVDENGSARTIPTDQAQSLVPQKPQVKTGPSFRVRLRDGSIIAAQGVSTDEEQLVVEPRRQDDLRVSLRQIQSIRFRKASPATDPKWLGMLENEGRGDLIAVRREGDVIDSIRAVVLGINDGKVDIDLDGSQTSAPISKLEGIVFAGSGSRSDPKATTVVRDVYGSQWQAVSMSFDNNTQMLNVDLGEGINHSFPADQIERIQWAGGAVKLAKLEAADLNYDRNPGIANNKTEVLAAFNTWTGPRVVDENDLLMPGGSQMEYRVEPDTTAARGSLRREQGVFQGGNVVARIAVDGKTVWEQEIKSADPLGFDIPVTNASRIRLEVDATDDGDAGDLIRWTNPRLVK